MRKILENIKNHFIPHKGNNHNPHFLRHKTMALVFMVVMVIETAFLVQTLFVFKKTDLLGAVLPAVLTSITNEDRQQNGVSPLSENDLLDKAAKMKAEDMANKGYFSHVTPEGFTPWHWLDIVGYKYSYAGENLAVNFFESEDVAKAWMNSPTHRANIVKKEYTEIGIGVASGVYEGRNTVFVAQFFGTPAKPIMNKVEKNTEPKTTSTKNKLVNTTQKTVKPNEVRVLGEETSTSTIAPSLIKDKSSIKLFIDKIITSPRQYSMYIYGGIALVVLIVLLLVLFIKSEIRHPLQIVRGVGMIALIILLSYFNLKTFGKTKVSVNDSSSNSYSVIAN